MNFLTLSAIAASVVAAADQQVVGSFIFNRHGDRLVKPSLYLTPIGSQEVFEAGSFIRNRYLDSSSPFRIEGLNATYQAEQLSAQTSNSDVLMKSQIGFLQGLYPPLSDINVSDDTLHGAGLSNGTTEDTPLDGYQYVMHSGVDPETPNAIWLTGDASCPAYTTASNAYYNSTEFKTLNQSTFEFYQSLAPLVDPAYMKKSAFNFGNAYKIFDYFWVNSIHNETFANLIKDKQAEADQVRTLQDQYSRALNYNASNLDTIIGGKSLAGAVLSKLNATKVAGDPLVSVYTGSYDLFYQIFAVLDLFSVDEALFTGNINYATVTAFELIKQNDDYFVQFSVRNGTDASIPLTAYPILGSNDTLIPYDDFVSKLNKVAIKDTASWCSACGSWDLDMCVPFSPQYLKAKADNFDLKSSGLSLAGAGGIGAGVTIGLFALIGAVAWLLLRKRSSPDAAAFAAGGHTDVESGFPVTKEISSSNASAGQSTH